MVRRVATLPTLGLRGEGAVSLSCCRCWPNETGTTGGEDLLLPPWRPMSSRGVLPGALPGLRAPEHAAQCVPNADATLLRTSSFAADISLLTSSSSPSFVNCSTFFSGYSHVMPCDASGSLGKGKRSRCVYLLEVISLHHILTPTHRTNAKVLEEGDTRRVKTGTGGPSYKKGKERG